ncbi:cation-dependent mannose-6-phosphate receptor-like [Physella acuta]|uniref:cation-dependent mannose-6-phosphate receptor-like n=1 Tax=Physella acuta TaxID=109671 RepID=UPI0027DAEBBE|nr:cation-dependent mannose-6-phosphate receptor-like [Physella acuta]
MTRTWLTACVAVLTLTLAAGQVKPRSCVRQDDCSCRFDDTGAVVNIRPLAKSDGTPLFKDVTGKDGLLYSYNPCVPFTEDQCVHSAVCQREGTNGTAKSLVNQTNAQFGFDGHHVQLTYFSSAGGLLRSAVVSLVCLVNQTTPVFTAYGYDEGSKLYNFQLGSQCACENGCYTAPDDGGISAGSVLIIIFFVTVFLYLSLGSVHGCVNKGESGVQVVPHYQFWLGFPGLVKDGCLFVVRCACCQPAPVKYDGV